MFWQQGDSPADPAAAQPGAPGSHLSSCHPRPPQASGIGALHCGRRFLGSAAAPTARQPQQGAPPPPASPGAITFHFGEGKDRTVAGAERGHPGRVLLHDEPSACRSASADRLHPGAGRGAPLRSGPGGLRRGGARAAGRSGPAPGAAGRAPVAVRLTAAAAPPSTSSLAAQPLHTRAHSLLPGGCCKLQRHVQVRSPRPPHGLTCSAPRPGTPGPPAAAAAARALPPSPVPAVASCGAGHQLPGLPFATTRSREGTPENLASSLKCEAFDFELRADFPAQSPELWFTGRSQKRSQASPTACVNFFERV